MKKRKSQALKKTVTKSGQVRYYKGGKRLSEKKAFEILKKKTQERQAKAKKSAEGLLYYKGKALTKAESYLLRLSLKDKVKTEKRLDKIQTNDGKKIFRTKQQLNDLIMQQARSMKDFFATENVRGKFKAGYEGKIDKRGSMDVAQFLQDGAFSRYKAVLMTPDYQMIVGKIGVVNYLATLEIMLMALIVEADEEKGVQVQFEYRIEVSTIHQSVFIDLQIINSERTVNDVIKEAIKDSKSIIKYYRDLTIRIGYS
jgi:hypothetical protein